MDMNINMHLQAARQRRHTRINNMPCMHRQLSCCRAGCEHVLTLLTYTGACAQVTLHVVKARQHIVRMRSSTCCPYSQVYAYKSRLHHKRRVTYPASLCSCQATGTIATQRQIFLGNPKGGATPLAGHTHNYSPPGTHLLRCEAACSQALIVRGHLDKPAHKLAVLDDGLPLQAHAHMPTPSCQRAV
jgi:hypothetical protein